MADLVPIKVLIFDDNQFELEEMERSLNGVDLLGYKFDTVSASSSENLQKILGKRSHFDVALLDIVEAQSNQKVGLKLIGDIAKAVPDCAIVMRSQLNDAQTIATCLQRGAHDFITKKSQRGELALRLIRALELVKSQKPPEKFSPTGKASAQKVAGNTTLQIAARVPKIVSSAVTTVHVTGETGTGKEVVADLFAQHVQTNSQTPFVKVNCGAINPNLLESELFGHVKGAFTGAASDKKGLLDAANNGWIFLDEIATMSMSAQVALLRVIENQEVRPVGSNKTHPIKVKVISATNEDLNRCVEAGTFRRDLQQRLSEVILFLPPLRSRTDEIQPAIDFFCSNMSGGPFLISDAALEILLALPWDRGNFRELRNCLRAMTEYAAGKILTPIGIPKEYLAKLDGLDSKSQGDDKAIVRSTSDGGSFRIELEVPKDSMDFESIADSLLLEIVRRTMRDNPRLSIRSLSARMGIPRSTLSDRLRRLIDKGVTTREELSQTFGLTL